MVEDVSKNIVIVLIIVALIVSIAGTWMVVEKLDIGKIEAKKISRPPEGNVGFTLIEEWPNTGISTGNVGLTVINGG